MKLRTTLSLRLLCILVFAILFSACGGGGGGGGGSSTATVTAPGKPTVYATAGRTLTQITWDAVSGATSYKVYNGVGVLLGTVTGTIYTDTGLVTGNTYNYQVSAVNSAGESAKSATSITANPWTRLLGTAADDGANDMVVDSSGNIFICGYTDGNLNGETNSGGTDAFIAKYNKSGTLQWVKLLGDGSFVSAYYIAVDRSGYIYITGITDGSLNGQTYSGGDDTFVAKYDSSGTLLWVRLLGTAGNEDPAGIFLRDVADSPVTVFISGTTTGDLDGNGNKGAEDIFVAKYDASGSIQWVTQLGSAASDKAIAMAGDSSGNVYITGSTAGNLDSNVNSGPDDVFLAKYNTSGVKQWVTLLGSAGSDVGRDVILDGSGNIYVTGSTDGSLDGNPVSGNIDAFVAKFNSSGAKQWVRQLVSAGDAYGRSITLDSSVNIYIAGDTTGVIGANVYTGGDDIFAAKYNSAGVFQWVKLLGSATDDDPFTIAIDQSGNLLIAGYTDGNLDSVVNSGPGPGLGGDAFICKFSTDGTLW